MVGMCRFLNNEECLDCAESCAEAAEAPPTCLNIDAKHAQ